MTTRELIVAEIGTLDEKDLSELYSFVKKFADAKRSASRPTLMTRLSQIKIDAPVDFATNLDLYVSGERRVG